MQPYLMKEVMKPHAWKTFKRWHCYMGLALKMQGEFWLSHPRHSVPMAKPLFKTRNPQRARLTSPPKDCSLIATPVFFVNSVYSIKGVILIAGNQHKGRSLLQYIINMGGATFYRRWGRDPKFFAEQKMLGTRRRSPSPKMTPHTPRCYSKLIRCVFRLLNT